MTEFNSVITLILSSKILTFVIIFTVLIIFGKGFILIGKLYNKIVNEFILSEILNITSEGAHDFISIVFVLAILLTCIIFLSAGGSI